jgi:hypothetical protein
MATEFQVTAKGNEGSSSMKEQQQACGNSSGVLNMWQCTSSVLKRGREAVVHNVSEQNSSSSIHTLIYRRGCSF